MSIHKLDKKTTLFIILGSIFLTNAILAELVGVKIFSLEGAMGIEPAQINILNDFYDFNLTAGVILWPVVFISTDIINEYYGKDGVKKISYLTAGMIIYMFIIITIATILPPADFWLNLHKVGSNGSPFNIDFAFTKIYRQGMGIIVASLTAFLVGQLLDVTVFQFIRKRTSSKMIWLRATGSTLVSQLVDSFLVLFIAFYLWERGEDTQWTIDMVISVGIVNYIYKFIIAVCLTPLLYIAHNIIDKFLGKELSQKMIEAASEE